MNARLAKRIALYTTGEWLWHTDTTGLPDNLAATLSRADDFRISEAQKEIAAELMRRSGFSSREEMQRSIGAA